MLRKICCVDIMIAQQYTTHRILYAFNSKSHINWMKGNNALFFAMPNKLFWSNDQPINQLYYKLKLIEDQNQEESDCHINKPAAKNSYAVIATITIGIWHEFSLHATTQWCHIFINTWKPVTSMMIENRSNDADLLLWTKDRKQSE